MALTSDYEIYDMVNRMERAIEFLKDKEQIQELTEKVSAVQHYLEKFNSLNDLMKHFKDLEKNIYVCKDMFTPEEAAKKTVDLITDKISSKSLDDSEKEFVGKLLEVDQIDESIRKTLSLAALVGFMAIPGILPASRLEDSMSRVNLQGKTVNSPDVKKAISKATKGEACNGMNRANIVNAVARTIFAEA
jgi:hypothetical protein